MHLQRKFLLRVEQFYEQWKPRTVGQVPENFLSILGPKFVQCFSTQRSVAHDALRFFAIDDFPRFADAHFRWQIFSELRFKPPATPHSFHKDGLEGEGTGQIRLRPATVLEM